MNLQVPYDQRFHLPTIDGDIIDQSNEEEQILHKNLDVGQQQSIEQKDLILVYIYNLPPWIKWRDLKAFLSNFIKDSTILHIQIWENHFENIYNGIISLNSYESSIELFENLNNLEWNGYILTIRIEDENNNLNFGIPLPQGLPQGPTTHFQPNNHQHPPPPPQFIPQIPQQIPQGYPQNGPHHPGSSPYYNFIPYFPFQQQQQQQSVLPPPIPILSPPTQQLPFQYTPATTPSNPISTLSSSRNFSRSSTAVPSPRIQPSRQITLRQLNYHDITDINDQSPPDRTRLFIGNIPFESDWRDLKDLLRSVGNIQRVEIPKLDNKSKGFGIATFASELDASRAIELLNGVNFQGRPLTVRYDKFPRNFSRVENNLKTTISVEKDKDDKEEKEEEISFDDGEFAREARSLIESLNINVDQLK